MNQIEAKKQKIEYCCYVIGLISFMVLGSLIGNNGITYMAVIIECVSLFVLLVNSGGSDLIGKLIRTRRKKNQYKEAAQLHRAYLLIQCITAVVMMAAYFLLTDFFANVVFKMPYLAIAMKILTPVILLKTLQCVMSGYFQGMGAHMPTVVCAIFRQLLFLLFGLLLTGRLTAYGEKVSALLNNMDYAGMYGAVGLCLAIVISEIFVSIFLLIVYIGSDRKREKRKSEDGLQKTESFSERFRLIALVSFPETMKAILKKLPFMLSIFIVLWNATDVSKVSHEFGVFYGYFICVCAIPVFAVSVQITQILSRLTAAIKKKDNRGVREILYAGMHYCWAMGLFISVFMAVLAPQISKVIQIDSTDVLQQYFAQGTAIIAILIMCIFIWKSLNILGARSLTYMLLALLNVVFVLSCVILRSREMDTIAVLIFSGLIACAIELIVSYVIIVRKYVLQPDLIRGFLIPLAAAGGMGLASMLLQHLLSPHVSSFVCLLLCFILSAVIYMVVLTATRSITETEVKHVYGPIGQKLLGMIIR